MSMLKMSSLAVVSAVVSRACTYVVLIVLARALPPSDFGAYTIAMVGVTVLSAMVSGGGDMWLNRFIRTQGGDAPVLRHYLAMATATAAVIGMLGVAGGLVAEQVGGLGILTVMTVLLGTSLGLAEAAFAVIRARGELALFFGLRDFVVPVAIVGALLALDPSTAFSALSIQAGAWVAALLALISLARARAAAIPLPRIPPVRLRGGLLRHTVTLMYGNLGSRLSAAVDVLVISAFIGLDGVGEYRVAGQFAAGFMIVQHFIFLGLPWQMRCLGATSAPGEGLRHVEDRQRLLLVLSAGALVVLLVLAEPILALLGERFVAAAPLFQVFAGIRFAELLWGPQHEILVSNGHAVTDAHSNLVALAAWPVAFFPLLLVVSPLPAAVTAVAAASLARQFFRRGALRRAGLPAVSGHPLVGWLAPVCGVALLLLSLTVQ